MLSDNQHIDDFFRKKDETFAPDNQLATTHWQQFKTQLSGPGDDADKHSHGKIRITRLLGLLVVAAVVLITAIKPFRHSKKKITATTKQQTTVAVGDTQTAARPFIKNKAAYPVSNLATTPTSGKGVRVQSPILIGAVPAAPVVTNRGNDTAEDSSPDATQLLQSFFQQLEKPTQEFTVNNTRDTTLVAKEGTRLFVPAHALLAKPGLVKIRIREYYKYEDIIAAKLTTTSNDEQLVTGGMLHISAEQDGKPVTMQPQKAITVHMPTDNYDKRMQLFAGQLTPRDDANITTLNWLPVGPFLQNFNDHSGPITYEINLNKVEPFTVSYGKKTTARFYVARGIDIPKTELQTRLKQRFGSYYDVIKIKRAPKKAYGEDKLVIDSTPVYDTAKVLPAYNMNANIRIRKENGMDQDSFVMAQQARLINVYSFAITSFGWYNCDRFLNAPGPKASLTVNFVQGATENNHVCLLVFARNKTVVQGNYWRGQKDYFVMIPAGERAILITVAVTADHVVSNMQPLTTSDTTITNLTFTPTTSEQFKQQLQTLLTTQKQ